MLEHAVRFIRTQPGVPRETVKRGELFWPASAFPHVPAQSVFEVPDHFRAMNCATFASRLALLTAFSNATRDTQTVARTAGRVGAWTSYLEFSGLHLLPWHWP
jgi:hypothetical protein